jgi:succinate dehydrogenase / fumarate reductase membrane anchor subunit
MNLLMSGLRAWVWQRLSALYVLAFTLYVTLDLAIARPFSYGAWRQWWSEPAVKVAAALFFLMLLLHAWIGLRNVLLDYVRPSGLRASVLAAVALALVAQALWVAGLLWGGQT